jgi:hypothetical protein
MVIVLLIPPTQWTLLYVQEDLKYVHPHETMRKKGEIT